MTYLDRAIKDGYAIITGPENKQKIIYVTSDNHTENYNDPEEKVRAEFWAELIYEYDYPAHRIKVEVTIPDRVPTDRADIVIFSDDECKKPYAVVECKRDGVTDAEFLQAIEQGVGNATWVKLRASYVVIIAGATRRVLDFSDDSTGILERENNIIADLPKAYGKPQAFRFYRGGEYTDVDGKKKKAPDIQPVAREDLITAIKKCHNTLWGGGRLSPPTAFGELCKLIFVKISDEQKPRKKGEPYQFQIKTHEPSSKLAERINALYNEQKVKDPEVFTDSIKVDDRVLRTVVSHLESINLNKTDLDVKGVAFEQFMDGFFKGDFGQYFTPRPIIEFAVKMMKPEHDWDVLDPACGSGGFLLHALDYMRSQASEYYDKDTVDYFNYWHDFASKHLYGIEINDEIARVAKMNMIVHDDGHTNVISFDALDSIDKMHDHNRGFEAGKFDLILTNPPFGSTITKAEKPYLANYVYGDNVIEKHGINRDSTGDREKTHYLCGKQGIFTRDRALIRPGFIRQLETRASTRSASFFHALGSPGRPHDGGGAAGAYRTRNGAKPLKQGHLRAKRGPLGPSRKSQQQTKRTGFAAHGHSIAETAPEGKRASCANGALIRA